MKKGDPHAVRVKGRWPVRTPEHHPHHKTRAVTLKTARIDLGMVEVVRWLDSFPEVLTHYCCQGLDEEKPDGQKPYVIFFCHCGLTLTRILSRVGYNAETEVEYYLPGGGLRYIMRFTSGKALRDFVAKLRVRPGRP